MPHGDGLLLAWATDIHLDHVAPDAVRAFARALGESGADHILLGGDISVAEDLESTLVTIAQEAVRPVHFVLGNHDYYGGSVADVRSRVVALASADLDWLPKTGPVVLVPGVTLVGHGGWGDARIGDFATSDVILNDYIHIADLHGHFDEAEWTGQYGTDTTLEHELNRLGDEAAASLAPQLAKAGRDGGVVIVLTHVPPFREAAWHEGKVSDPEILPHYTCGAVGEVLVAAADRHPDCRFHVLCGHTHGAGEATIRPNLTVTTQAARYGRPGYRLVRVRDGAVSVEDAPSL